MGKNSNKKRNELRRELLKNKLIMLGYDIENLDNIPKTFDENRSLRILGRVADMLEEFVYREREASDKNLEERNKNEKTEIKNRKELIRSLRGLDEDYCKNMQIKVGERDWEIYSGMVREMADMFKSINSDVFKGATKAYGALDEELLKDIVRSFTDSTSFQRACEIEDRFVRDEGERFIEMARDTEYDDKTVNKTAPAVRLDELVREVQSTGREKERHIQAYGKYKKFIESDSKFVELRGKGYGGKKEDEQLL